MADGEVARAIVVQRTESPGVFRLVCRRCDLSIEVTMTSMSLNEYEERADAFLAEHDHDGPPPEAVIRLD